MRAELRRGGGQLRLGLRAWLLLLAAMACAVVGLAGRTGGILPAGAQAAASSVKTDEVCFLVHNQGDPERSRTYAVRYYTGVPTPQTKVLVLIHGNSVTHGLWDLRPDFSVARRLAEDGYLVIAYERLGYPRSPYARPAGWGYTLTLSSQRDMMHEVVGELKAGTYALANHSACSELDAPMVGLRSQTIVLVGHSGGGALVSGYPGLYHDVAGIVQMGWSNQGLSPDGTAHIASIYARAEGADYVNAFPTAEDCRKALLFLPGVLPSIEPRFCEGSFVRAPAGEIAGITKTIADNLAFIPRVGPGLPVLLAWEDHDFFFTAESMAAEFQYWKAHCGCDVQSWTQRDSGHAFIAHQSMPEFTSELERWLASKGLAAS